jgi:hypothetical protein
LHERRQHSTSAAVGSLLIERNARKQVDDFRAFLAAVGQIRLPLGAITLISGLTTNNVPDYFLLGPCPSHYPTRSLDVTIQLIVVHGHNSLQYRLDGVNQDAPGTNIREKIKHKVKISEK